MTISDDGHQPGGSKDSAVYHGTTTQQTSVAIYVCTYERNGPLRTMLDSLVVAAKASQPDIEVGVVIIDDNPDGRAKEVYEAFDDSALLLGLHYRHSGAQNISIARNVGLETASNIADWVAMVDDDQVVIERWIDEMFTIQRRYSADAVTGPVLLRYPDDAPGWLTEQPFSAITEAELREDGIDVPVCSTGNSMLRSSWLKDNPGIRFRSDLGELGGEDMVFYGAAIKKGLKAHYAVDAVAYGEQPPERSTFGSMLRSCYWLGNSEYITNMRSGSASRQRVFLRASKRGLSAMIRPVQRLIKGNSPQWRFAAAKVAQASGMIVGVAGVKVKHK